MNAITEKLLEEQTNCSNINNNLLQEIQEIHLKIGAFLGSLPKAFTELGEFKGMTDGKFNE